MKTKLKPQAIIEAHVLKIEPPLVEVARRRQHNRNFKSLRVYNGANPAY